MAWVRVHRMFLNNLVVCFEQCSEWRLLSLGLALGVSDDLIEEADICTS